MITLSQLPHTKQWMRACDQGWLGCTYILVHLTDKSQADVKLAFPNLLFHFSLLHLALRRKQLISHAEWEKWSISVLHNKYGLFMGHWERELDCREDHSQPHLCCFAKSIMKGRRLRYHAKVLSHLLRAAAMRGGGCLCKLASVLTIPTELTHHATDLL